MAQPLLPTPQETRTEVLKELAAIRGQLEVIAGALQAVLLTMPDGSAAVATFNQGIDEIPN